MKNTDFDFEKDINDQKAIAKYLSAAIEDEDPDVFLQALVDVAKARGISKIADGAGLSRESLYKNLAPGAQPRFEALMNISSVIGISFVPSPIQLVGYLNKLSKRKPE